MTTGNGASPSIDREQVDELLKQPQFRLVRESLDQAEQCIQRNFPKVAQRHLIDAASRLLRLIRRRDIATPALRLVYGALHAQAAEMLRGTGSPK